MDNTKYIEDYFKGSNSEEQKLRFEARILEDASFAEEVAFYISAAGALKQEQDEERRLAFREIYQRKKGMKVRQPAKGMWKYMAVAAVISVILIAGWFFVNNRNSPEQLADKYILENMQTLSVSMGAADSMQVAIDLFNNGNFQDAMSVLERLHAQYPENEAINKYAGITALKQENYERAIYYFSLLEADTGLYSNPGKFYKALALIKRNKNQDKKEAKQLLEEVVKNNLEGKKGAEQLLKRL